MHGNINDLKGQRFGNLEVIGLTDLKTQKHRCAVWECKCDCGNTCYKTSTDLQDKRRKTWSCGCMTKGKRQFPNKFVSKTETSCQNKIIKISEKFGVIELLTAAIMRNNNLNYKEANQIAEKLKSSDCIFDRLIDDLIGEEV